jgi:hypothetical protein
MSLENLNEVRPLKHQIKREGVVIINTNDIDMAKAKWKPKTDEHWEWVRNGSVIVDKPRGQEPSES